MNDQPDKQAEPPAETQSAVEWVTERLAGITTDPSYPPDLYLTEDDALELARRCDEWERQHGHEWVHRRVAEQEVATFKANNRYQRGFHDGEESLRAQLAAAQAEAGRLREALEALLEPQTEECRLDHHGYCQAHYLESANSCCVAKARAALAKEGGE